MSAVPDLDVASADARKRGAERLHEAIAAAYDPRADFAEKVEVALGAALAFLAAEPDLAHQLAVEPYFLWDDASVACRERWRKRYGALLRHAAAQSPEALTHPPFVEPALIGGIRFQIALRVIAGQTAELPALLPGLLRFVLSYYMDPKQTASHVRAFRATQ